jgi:hypothetical protein
MRDICVSRFEMVCLTIWTGLRKCALLRVSKPSYPHMSKPMRLMSIAYSNSSIASLFDYLYHCYIVYSMVVGWILHCYRQGLQVICDQPHLLDSRNNGMSNWLPLGLSSYYAYTLLWHMDYPSVNPSDNSSQFTASSISTSMLFTVPNVLGSLFSSLSVLAHTSG